MSNVSHAIQSCLNGLATYLAAQVPGLTVIKEWPSANQQLVYPTVTIFTGQVKVMNRSAEQLSVTDPDGSNQVVVTEVIGEYDAKMQLDLWCSDKLQRDTVLGHVFNAINLAVASQNSKPAGLSLQLTDYYNDYVRFDIDGFTYLDDEAAAERQERRVKIDVLLNCRAIQQRTLYAIIQVQATVGTSLDGTNFNDDTAGTETHTVVP